MGQVAQRRSADSGGRADIYVVEYGQISPRRVFKRWSQKVGRQRKEEGPIISLGSLDLGTGEKSRLQSES